MTMAAATEASTEARTAAADGGANNKSSSKGNSSKDYYRYLFEDNKTPTKILDALLRAIAKHIVRNALSHVGPVVSVRLIQVQTPDQTDDANPLYAATRSMASVT